MPSIDRPVTLNDDRDEKNPSIHHSTQLDLFVFNSMPSSPISKKIDANEQVFCLFASTNQVLIIIMMIGSSQVSAAAADMWCRCDRIESKRRQIDWEWSRREERVARLVIQSMSDVERLMSIHQSLAVIYDDFSSEIDKRIVRRKKIRKSSAVNWWNLLSSLCVFSFLSTLLTRTRMKQSYVQEREKEEDDLSRLSLVVIWQIALR